MRGSIRSGSQSAEADCSDDWRVTSDGSRNEAVRVAGLGERPAWAEILTSEEREGAKEIRDDILRARFVVSRGLRRKMLADATGRSPQELCFVEDGDKKPRLADAGGWDFNVSHSGDYVAVAVARRAVGIDLEKVRPVREMVSLVRRYFHPDESAAWAACDDSLREEAFFVLWSAREAAMKCAGLGLAKGLAKTRVDPVILRDGWSEGRVDQIPVQLRRMDAPAGYLMVVARG